MSDDDRKDMERRIAGARQQRLATLSALEGAVGGGKSLDDMLKKTGAAVLGKLDHVIGLDAPVPKNVPAGGGAAPDVAGRERAITERALTSSEAPAEARAAALRVTGHSINESEEGIDRLLAVMADAGEPTQLRREALRTVRQFRFSSRTLRDKRPELVAALRTLLDDPDLELRSTGAEMLAKEKDEEVQRRLLSGLAGESEPIVDAARAIQLLGYDVHAEHLPLLHEIVDRSEDVRAREEAIRVLSSDPSAAGLLADILRDGRESTVIRSAAAVALQNVAPLEFERHARAIAVDEGDDAELRAMLIAALGRFANPASLLEDTELNQRVERIAGDEGAHSELREAARGYQTRVARGP